PQPEQVPGGREQLLLPAVELPVHPGDLVVLAVGVVVPQLAAPELVAGGEHRRAGGEQERAEEVAHGTAAPDEDVGTELVHPRRAPRPDRGVAGSATLLALLALGDGDRPLDLVVPRAVVVAAVPVVLAVRLVVLEVVGDEVGEGEAVVRGHVVDARQRAATAGDGPVREEVGGSGEARREVPEVLARAAGDAGGRVAEPEGPHGVPEAVVPVRERRRELAGAPAAG